MLSQINQRMIALQSEVNGLQNQVKVLKTQLKTERLKNNKVEYHSAHTSKVSIKNTVIHKTK